jgi:hypothetical protein
MRISRHATRRLFPISFAPIILAVTGCGTAPKVQPEPATIIREVEKPLPQSARDACDVRADDGSFGGYVAALEAALALCQAEIDARLARP